MKSPKEFKILLKQFVEPVEDVDTSIVETVGKLEDFVNK